MTQQERSGLNEAAEISAHAGGAVRGAIKTGKMVSGAAKALLPQAARCGGSGTLDTSQGGCCHHCRVAGASRPVHHAAAFPDLRRVDQGRG